MKILHYINQFFGQLGGEDSAYAPLEIREGTVGPGKLLAGMLENADIVATAICGDNYFVENTDHVSQQLKGMLKKYEIDLVVAGPGFNAGRYGMACGCVCKIAFEEEMIAVSALYEENPGLELYKKYGYIFPAEIQARGMKAALEKISAFVNKAAAGQAIGLPEEEGYFPRGIRRPAWRQKTGAARAVDMAVAKALGQPFTTEVEVPIFDHIEPSKPVIDLAKARVALATSGGIVPVGNPDHLEALSASKWMEYTKADFGGDFKNLKAEVAHGGYDPVYGNEDGNRVLPADAMEELEKRGVIGKFHEKMYVTVGNCMDVAKATKYGKEMAAKMIADGVEAVVLTSTWGTDTRCGATLVKQIDDAGIPVVHLCTIVPISYSVGANRIYAAVAIPHPAGYPKLDQDAEFASRVALVEKAVETTAVPVVEQTIFGK